MVCGDPERTAVYITRHAGLDAGVICFSECAFQFEMHERRVIGSSDDVQTQARRVFDALRSFDATDVTEIWAQCPDDTGLGLAVANRLKKAAGFKVVNVV